MKYQGVPFPGWSGGLISGPKTGIHRAMDFDSQNDAIRRVVVLPLAIPLRRLTTGGAA